MHKSSIAAEDMLKLRQYFPGGRGSNNAWTDQSDFWGLSGFPSASILGAAVEKVGEKSPSSHSELKFYSKILTEQRKNYQGGSKQKDQTYPMFVCENLLTILVIRHFGTSNYSM